MLSPAMRSPIRARSVRTRRTLVAPTLLLLMLAAAERQPVGRSPRRRLGTTIRKGAP